MSASEKLKALVASKAIDWPAPSYEAYRMAEDAERLRKNAIERALPEIIAVVEAAEHVTFYGQEAHRFNEWHGSEIVIALAALDAKLGQA